MHEPSGWHDVWPLVHINDPRLVWERQPTLLLAEIVFTALFLGVTWHAFKWNVRTRAERRRRVALWAAAVIGGACIELCTVLKRDVGNFYHSQATVMLLGLREPLYMLVGCYGFFNYIGCAMVWEWSGETPRRQSDGGKRGTLPTGTRVVVAGSLRGPWTQALTAGLIGSLGWGLLDTVGLKLLWWTWHNDEPLYKDRRYGVPIASSFWIFSSITSLGMVFHWWRDRFHDSPMVKAEEGKEEAEERPKLPSTKKMSARPGHPGPNLESQTARLDAHEYMNMLLLGASLGPLATIGVMNLPFAVLYHPFVTAAGFNAAFPFAIFRGCAWTALMGACFQDPDENSGGTTRRDGFKWLQAKIDKIKEMAEGGADSDDSHSDPTGLSDEYATESESSGEEEEEADEDDMSKVTTSSKINEDRTDHPLIGKGEEVVSVEYVGVRSTWLPLALVGTTCLFVVSLIYGSTPETSVRVSFGQPVTFDKGKCMSAVEASFWGGFERKKYVCIDRLDEDRDVYRPCQQDLPAEKSWRQKRKEAVAGRDMSIVDDAWFPLCGTEMSAELQRAVLFEVLQLCVACLGVYFCGLPEAVRKKVQDLAISDLGAMSILLVVSMAMLNPPYDERTPRAPIPANPRVLAVIHGLKWAIVVGLATWIAWGAMQRWPKR